MASEDQSTDTTSERTNSTLWMGAIQPTWTENFVKHIFLTTLAENVEVKLFQNNIGSYDQLNRRPIGYAFITFQTVEAAQKAKEFLQNKPIGNTNVVFRLNWAVRDKKLRSRKQDKSQFAMFVGDLAETVTDEILKVTFTERFPSCTSANVVIDPITGQSKKFGFVHFTRAEEYSAALHTMKGLVICGRAIRVGHATSKHTASMAHTLTGFRLPFPQTSRSNELTGPVTQSTGSVDYATYINLCTITVEDLPPQIRELEIGKHFQACGRVIDVRIDLYKNIARVKFEKPEGAQKALAIMNGSRIGVNRIKVSWSSNHPEQDALGRTQQLDSRSLVGFNTQPQAISILNFQDVSTIKYISNYSGLHGVPNAPVAMNYNCVGFVSKPAHSSPCGFYNVPNQPQVSYQKPLSMNFNEQQRMTANWNGTNTKSKYSFT